MVVGGGVAIPMTLVGSVVLIVVFLRYVSIALVHSIQGGIKEVSMVKKLNVRSMILLSSLFESSWAIAVGCVAGHLLT